MITAKTPGGLRRLAVLWFAWNCGCVTALGQPDAAEVPEAAEIARLPEQNPISAETWPIWRERFLLWYEDRSGATDDFEEQLANYVGQQFNAKEKSFRAPLADDRVAWHLLGNFYMQVKDSANPGESLQAAEAAYQRSLEKSAEALDRDQKLGADPQQALGPQVVDQIRKLANLDTPQFQQAMEAMNAKQYAVAEGLFEKALAADPDNVELAQWLAGALLSRQGPDGAGGPAADRLGKLCQHFPQDGDLQTYYAVALAREDRHAESAAALRKAGQLGTKPADLVGADTVRQLQEINRPSLVMQFLRVMGWFAAAYAVVMALMACAGILLSAITPRVPEPPLGIEFGRGEVFVSGQESLLARWYMLVLITGLLLFYVSVPFVIAGLVASTGAALYLIFQLPRIPVQLLVIVVLTGLSMAWAVLKSVFASHGSASFGVRKTPEDCPRLTAAIRELASRTDTAPMDEIYVAPGAAIGVHQEGRGPFGMFGVKRRVLTLGLSTMSALTVSELKAILAHEYAHFSHRDTFYSRFIHQVTLSIQQALGGMAAAGGRLNYVNPFFWFFWLYYHTYSMLACGFSRSREFLADRMAVSLYGKEAFISALTKVATEGMMFEGTMFHNVNSLLAEGKAFENIYESFRDFHQQNVSSEDRQKMYRALLEEKPSLFATHPTFQERLRAVTPFADLPPQEPQPANSLFEDPVAIEKELTDYLTEYVALVRQMQAQAAAASD